MISHGPRRPPRSDLDLYDRVAERSSARVIRDYSTSFALAARLLGPTVRADVRNIYGLVRIADEIVDGAATEAGLDTAEQCRMLDRLESETDTAVCSGFSTNLVVHSFAVTARKSQIGNELTRPFFWSMRRDLRSGTFTHEEFRRYVHGSAEVVGLMCLRVFIRDQMIDDGARAALEEGATRLGAAFQKLNFLRDLAADYQVLGRSYFPGLDATSPTEAQKDAILDEIEEDLAIAGRAIPHLPLNSRAAVAAAHGLFSALALRLRHTPASELMQSRAHVRNTTKAVILARAALLRGVS
jgi:phytoene/squalene synthetase